MVSKIIGIAGWFVIATLKGILYVSLFTIKIALEFFKIFLLLFGLVVRLFIILVRGKTLQ